MGPLGSGGLLDGRRRRRLEPFRAFGIETWPQALLKWTLSDQRVDVVIPATSRPGARAEHPAAGTHPGSAPTSVGYVERLAGA